jgi:phosphatidylserine decarboxylase
MATKIRKYRIHPKGWPFISIFAVVAAALFLIPNLAGTILGWTGVILTLWSAYFFRDPDRVTPIGNALVISPADGIIQSINHAAPPAELGMPDGSMRRISVFMNIFDCHVNRCPVSGKIEKSAYNPGKFFNASLDKASEYNERRGIRIKSSDGHDLAVVQIAGLIARRIISWIPDGSPVEAGQRFGMIRFGSRVDIYLENSVAIFVTEGQRAIAGETVLASYEPGIADYKGAIR